MRQTIPDNKIHIIFVTHDDCNKHCGNQEVETTMSSIQDAGIPICPECGDELVYDRTEIE